MKNNSTALMVSSSDEAALLAAPVLAAVFLPLTISLGWARINNLSSLCENLVLNGYRVGSNPEK